MRKVLTIIVSLSVILLLLFATNRIMFYRLCYGVCRNDGIAKKIAYSYLNGSYGVNPSYKNARYYLYISAGSGDIESMSDLAWMLDTGRGGDVNSAEAVDWYMKAYKNGDKRSELALRKKHIIK